MSSEQARDLRQQGIAAAKAGQKDQARQLLQQSIRLEPSSEAAWLWLASVARDQRERVFCLQKILEINPNNEQALKALAQVDAALTSPTMGPLSPPAAGGGLVKRLTQTSEQPAVSPVPPRVSTQEMMAQAPGVPLPDADKVRRAAEAAEAIVRQELEAPTTSAVKWVRKTKGRAGERDIWVLRGYIAAGSLIALAVLCTASYFVVANTPPLAAVVFAPTATLTFTPTHTSTPTPGLTPTPSPTPRVQPPATATVPVSVPTADVYALEVTDVYPEILEAPLLSAISLMDRGEYDVALPTLAAERANTSTRFNPNPYYYEAVALARDGNFTAALRTLREAEGRLEEAPNDNFQPLIDTGFAYVHLLQADDALLQGDEAGAAADVAEAQTRAEAAAEGDPRLALAHLFLGRSYALQGDERAALEALNAGLDVADLQNDVNLIAEKARVYLQQGEYERADREAFLALYIDPTTAAAYEVQIMSALAQDDPGLAVLRAQAYLFYYPGNADAWRMLGDARTVEGNPDLAIDAYSQALEGDGGDAVTIAALMGRSAAYSALGRYDGAYEDTTLALEIVERPDIRALRMEAAYQTGQYAIALEDAESLQGTNVDPARIAWVQGRALVEQAEADDEAAGSQAITLLQTARALPDVAASGMVDEYIARAEYSNNNFSDALDAINTALTAGDTVMRRYVRGLVLQARRENVEAAADYEWVLAWSSVYPFQFAGDASARLEEMR